MTVYTVPDCLDCAAVKNLLTEAGISYREVDISQIPDSREALALLSGFRTVPQVFVGGQFIGQVADIRYLLQSGKITSILNSHEERD